MAMASYPLRLAIIAFMATGATLTAAQNSGSGTTTRYWDCCKPSCAWNDLGRLGIQSAVKTCDITDRPITDTSAASGCTGGPAYMCSDQSPWIVGPNLAYGFASVSAWGSNCCQCYQLTFTSGAVAGKKMIVQATNTGYDVGPTQFDIAIPGGGFGIFDGCSKKWGATSAVWGAQYGGSSTDTCSSFPDSLKAGCKFRWDSKFFNGSDNPSVNWEKVRCPRAITARSGCVRIGDGPTANGSPSDPETSPSSTTPVVSSTSAISSSSTVIDIESITTSTTTETSRPASSTEASVYTLLTSFVTSTVSSSAAAVQTSSNTALSYESSSVTTVETPSSATSTDGYPSSAATEISSSITSTPSSTTVEILSSSTSTDGYPSAAATEISSSITSTSSSTTVETLSSSTSTSVFSPLAEDQSSSSTTLIEVFPTAMAVSPEVPVKIAEPVVDDDDTCER